MRIIISKHGGFCKGVSRAVETAEKISGKGVYILGDLIHNERVMNKIKNLGSTVVYSPEEVKGGKVLIRSHGEPKKVFDYFDEKGIEVIDCTCPFVKRTQKIVSEYAEKGYKII